VRVLEALRRDTPSLSFEFYPPKAPDGAPSLLSRARRLDALGPDFVSVTYHAGGAGGDARRAASVDTTRALADATAAARVAHLTLAGQTRAELVGVVRRFAEAGVEGFLALRGDPPGGPAAEWSPTPGGLTYAADLVALVREISGLPVGVAAFPHGHPAAPSLEHDAEVLAAKQAAGASFALSQVVFGAEAYFRLVDRARRAGATLPIIPGIMPLTAGAKVARLELFAGAPLPASLLERWAQADGAAARDRVGVAWSVALGRELLAGGAPGLHFYTLGSAAAPEAVWRGLDPGAAGAAGAAGRNADNA
jgi:methylenetetrahydrofolate reductase (NADPH)